MSIRRMTMVVAAAMVAMWGCASQRTVVPAGAVRVEVARVGLDSHGAPFVLLQESGGRLLLPIMIGAAEAQAITLELHGLNPGRPLTYDLMATLLHSTGNHVDLVVVSGLWGQIYHAKISLDRGRIEVDSRPSDAIALALATNAPIYVAKKLLQANAKGAPFSAPGHEMERGLGLTVQALSPDIAPFFKARPNTAVVIANEDAAAAGAGIERGDLLTKVDGDSVRTLRDFDRIVARLAPQTAVAVTIRHGSEERQVTLRTGKR